MKFIEVNCPVCSENDYKVLFPDILGQNPPIFGYKWVPDIRKTYRIVRCKSCGHVYCSPRLEDMYKYYHDTVDEDYLENSDLRIHTAKRLVKTIQKFVPSGRLLDIGCSTGDFLSVARNIYEVEGLELSKWAFEIAKNKGLTIHTKSINELAESKRFYDIITMWGVIEHLEYPLIEMQNANRLLNIGGVVCLWTGNVDSFYFRILGQKWWYILGQHIQFFSKRSLDRLMHDTGFERAYMGVYPYVISFRYLATSLSRYHFIGSAAKNLFRVIALENYKFTLKKSDEMFAIYRKTRNIKN